MVKLRIATLQINALLGSVEENILKVEKILNKSLASPNFKPIDLLVLPEMALTGYNFQSARQLRPYLESPSLPGKMLKWGSQLSQKLNCFTVIGYPEISNNDKILNSAIVFDGNGQVLHNYNKSFLYETDEVWGCSEGEGFKVFTLKNSIKTSIGICMDLNPYKFQEPFNKFEYSSHCFANEIDLIITPMNWLHNKSPSLIENLSNSERKRLENSFNKQFDEIKDQIVVNDTHQELAYDSENICREFTDLHKPDFTNLDYWIVRFLPFLNHYMKPLKNHKRATLIVSNRTGLEGDILFGGTSSILQFNGKSSDKPEGFDSIDIDNQSVDVLGSLGKGDEGILIRDVDI
ncbi:hypothetical protein WICMUC_003123 [Wickerhamomyces mucosus]|uniref:CN hydrolase domain-containing protein n=1 Tax=Wickerhamomyces mucosus TaxID=1378264 RepID=A0A9P8PMP5_9ASCO|nr:hypothetical protein WICMUC_003123 [Wickerhamomyces mucosus]